MFFFLDDLPSPKNPALFLQHIVCALQRMVSHLASKPAQLTLKKLHVFSKDSLFAFQFQENNLLLIIDLDPRAVCYRIDTIPDSSSQSLADLLEEINAFFSTNYAHWPFKMSPQAKNTIKPLTRNSDFALDYFFLHHLPSIHATDHDHKGTLTISFGNHTNALQISITRETDSYVSQLIYYTAQEHTRSSAQLIFSSHTASTLEQISSPPQMLFQDTALYSLPSQPSVHASNASKTAQCQSIAKRYVKGHKNALENFFRLWMQKQKKEKKRLNIAIKNIEKENPLQLQNFAQRLNNTPSMREQLKREIEAARHGNQPVKLLDEVNAQEIILAQKVHSSDPSYYIDALFSKIKRQKSRLDQLLAEQNILEDRQQALSQVLLPVQATGTEVKYFPTPFIDLVNNRLSGHNTTLYTTQLVQNCKQAPSRQKRIPYRLYRSRNGVEILVGKNAVDNMQLSFHYARSDDIWLHVHPFPGSHVVMRASNTDDRESLHAAMLLAKHFSSKARNLNEVFITVSQGKYVRRIRGAPAGKVSLTYSEQRRVYSDHKALKDILSREVEV